MVIVHIKLNGVRGLYCGVIPKGVEWVEPYVAVDSEPSALKKYGGWQGTKEHGGGRAICIDCINNAKMMGHLAKSILYGIVARQRRKDTKGKWNWHACPLRYMHAVNETHAKKIFYANHNRNHTKIEYIGQVVGYHVADSDAKYLFV